MPGENSYSYGTGRYSGPGGRGRPGERLGRLGRPDALRTKNALALGRDDLEWLCQRGVAAFADGFGQQLAISRRGNVREK
ncbi:hypothetical protein GCM10010517_71100 [Streptosporangium fragile]|uniref:Uncharacterized protein n=1 Tax=Streptosporangium fragile TaxID=46186 RepID=A0ABN3W895_9ACTN